ncbi:DMT family transporter [Solimonas sp. SE-A11]|uniref:DMT family transporter n=1 Tax=Solimonas sp. SE-A11 TaxID=3054954 RepID=UPI00259C906D|nr:DMT family transporter [Solimonas sp. SE-A11]MDM4769901.1 DMT family transporter [Solimonas sp. SE-A11]
MSTSSKETLGGVALFMVGILLLASMDTTTKYLVALYPAVVVVALRYIVQCLLMVLLLAPSRGYGLIRTRRTGLVLLRACCLGLASLCMTLALQRMPVAETSAIVFLYPILVVLMAGPVLQERVGSLGWLAVAAGFVGVLLIARPGGGLDAAGVVLALCAAILNAIYQLLSRVLASTERAITLQFHAALVGAVCYGMALPWFWTGPVPPAAHLLLFGCAGVLGGMGHFLVTAAYRHSPASVLAPMQYVQLIWAALLGWLVFSQVPDGLGLFGMIVVAAAGATVALNSRRGCRTSNWRPTAGKAG